MNEVASFDVIALFVITFQEEIHVRKLSFLHHIINLEAKDPLFKLYCEQKSLPFEPNWASETRDLLKLYGIQQDEDVIKAMNVGKWKNLVKEKVKKKAFEDLQADLLTKSKTRSLVYSCLKTQPYVFRLPPHEARLIFKARAKSINCKANRSSRYTNDVCRICNETKEDQPHIVNCPVLFGVDCEFVDISIVDEHQNEDWTKLKTICTRLDTFLKEIESIN